MTGRKNRKWTPEAIQDMKEKFLESVKTKGISNSMTEFSVGTIMHKWRREDSDFERMISKAQKSWVLKRQDKRKRDFLKYYAESDIISACKEAHVAVPTIENWRRQDKVFDKKFREIKSAKNPNANNDDRTKIKQKIKDLEYEVELLRERELELAKSDDTNGFIATRRKVDLMLYKLEFLRREKMNLYATEYFFNPR